MASEGGGGGSDPRMKKAVSFADGTKPADVEIEMAEGGDGALGRNESFAKMSHFKKGKGHRRHDADANTGIDPHAMDVAVAATSRRPTRLQLQRALSTHDIAAGGGGMCDRFMNKLVNWATCDKKPLIKRIPSVKELIPEMNSSERRPTMRRLTLSRDTLFGAGSMGKEGHGKAGALHHGHDASHAFVLHPFSHVRRVWDVTIVTAVLYLCWYIPYTIGYDWWEPQQGLKIFMYVLDVWFIVDIFLNFRTGHVHDGHLVMDPRKIARHYLEFWFWIDVLACPS